MRSFFLLFALFVLALPSAAQQVHMTFDVLSAPGPLSDHPAGGSQNQLDIGDLPPGTAFDLLIRVDGLTEPLGGYELTLEYPAAWVHIDRTDASWHQPGTAFLDGQPVQLLPHDPSGAPDASTIDNDLGQVQLGAYLKPLDQLPDPGALNGQVLLRVRFLTDRDMALTRPPLDDQGGFIALVANSVNLADIKRQSTRPVLLQDRVYLRHAQRENNTPPTIISYSNHASAALGVPLEFTAQASDAQGQALSYYWDFNGEANPLGNPANHTFGFADSAARVTLLVWDGMAASQVSWPIELRDPIAFADPAFQACAAGRMDQNGDGTVDLWEANEVSASGVWLPCSGMGITSLEGIQAFDLISFADFSFNQLADVTALYDANIAGNLSLAHNQITQLPLIGEGRRASNNPQANFLNGLDVSHNQLTELPFAYERLRRLDATGNSLTLPPDTSLAASGLAVFRMRDNALTQLPDFAGHTRLYRMWLGGNPLTALPDLNAATALQWVDVAGMSLDGSACTDLAALQARLGAANPPLVDPQQTGLLSCSGAHTPPVILTASVPAQVYARERFSLQATAEDADGDNLVLLWDSGVFSEIRTGSQVAYVFADPGIKTLNLWVIDAHGAFSQQTFQVQVLPARVTPPRLTTNQSDFSYVNFHLDKGFTGLHSFTAGALAGDDPNLVFEWEFGDGSPAVSGSNVNHIYSAPGLYTYTVTVVDGNGAADQSSQAVLIEAQPNNPPQITALNGPAQLGLQVTASFSASASDADNHVLTYHWDFGDGNQAQGASVQHAYDLEGQFLVNLTVVDELGGADSDSMTVTVSNVAPVITGPQQLDAEQGLFLSAAYSVQDADGNLDSVSAINLPSGALFQQNTFSWLPSFGQAGRFAFTVRAVDRAGATTDYPVTIDIPDTHGQSDPSRIAALDRLAQLQHTMSTWPNQVFSNQQRRVQEYRDFFLATHLPQLQSALLAVDCTAADAAALAMLEAADDGALDGDSRKDKLEPGPEKSHAFAELTAIRAMWQQDPALLNCGGTQPDPQPPVVEGPASLNGTEDNLLEAVYSASDPDDDLASLTAANLPPGSSFSNGLFSWTPGTGQAENYTFTVEARDETGLSDQLQVQVTIQTPVNNGPDWDALAADVEAWRSTMNGFPLPAYSSNSRKAPDLRDWYVQDRLPALHQALLDRDGNTATNLLQELINATDDGQYDGDSRKDKMEPGPEKDQSLNSFMDFQARLQNLG